MDPLRLNIREKSLNIREKSVIRQRKREAPLGTFPFPHLFLPLRENIGKKKRKKNMFEGKKKKKITNAEVLDKRN